MIELELGLLIFFGAHLFSAFRTRDPERELPNRIGRSAYRASYSLISAVGLGLMIHGFGTAEGMAPLYASPGWARSATIGLMLPALILIAATYLPNGFIKQTSRHPMLVGIGLWAVAHLMTGANLPRLLLFGAFLAFSMIDFVAASARAPAPSLDPEAASQALTAPALKFDVLAITIGAAGYAAIVLWLHRALIGIDLFGG